MQMQASNLFSCSCGMFYYML